MYILDNASNSGRDEIFKEDFFTEKFDEQNDEDIMNKLKDQTSDMKPFLNSLNLKEELKNYKDEEDKEAQQSKSSNNKILIENQLEEEDKQNERRGHIVMTGNGVSDYRQHIICEMEGTNTPQLGGQPVSPVSEEGTVQNVNNYRIETGSQSLESTLSDEKKLKQEINEINIQQQQINLLQDLAQEDKVMIGEEIAEDIFKVLLQEVKIDLDLLLIKNIKSPLKDENEHHPNYFLSESGRFLIFERKGIKTDLFAIERYVEEVLDEV